MAMIFLSGAVYANTEVIVDHNAKKSHALNFPFNFSFPN